MKRVFRYMNRNKSLGIRYFFGNVDSSGHTGSFDADFNRCPITRENVGVYAFLQSRDALFWKYIKPILTVGSTTEAEYTALDMATQEAVWTERIFCFAKKTGPSVFLRI